MKSVLFSKKTKPDPELLALKAELQIAQADLAHAYCQFNQALDPELVESCIYQINAVKARCNYLIRSIKERSPEALAAFSRVPAVTQHGLGGGKAERKALAPQREDQRLETCEDDGGEAAWT